MDFTQRLGEVLADMPKIGLAETGKVRLMNRTDRKYLANKKQLLRFLELTKGDYMVLVASESLCRFIPLLIGTPTTTFSM